MHILGIGLLSLTKRLTDRLTFWVFLNTVKICELICLSVYRFVKIYAENWRTVLSCKTVKAFIFKLLVSFDLFPPKDRLSYGQRMAKRVNCHMSFKKKM